MPRRRHIPAALLTIVLALSGCDQSFEPFQESAAELSINGFLNPTSDIQFVRITPIRSSIFTSRDPLGVNVTLDNLDSGRRVALRDSVFQHIATFVDSSVAQYAHAYWTREPIDPQSRYLLTVTKEDGTVATALASTPSDFTPTIRNANGLVSLRVRAEHLAMVHVQCTGDLRVVTNPLNVLPVSAPFSVPGSTGGQFDVPISRNFLVDLACPVINSSVLVVASGSPWPTGRQVSAAALLQELPENITNGVGFFAGVLTKVIPWETCTLSPQTGPCDLVYDEEVVHVEGRVLDARCGGPVTTADIRLSEVLPSPPVRVFDTSVDSLALGRYKFDLLTGGVRYAIRASSQKRMPPEPGSPPSPGQLVYGVYEDTLTFSPAERRVVDLVLPRLVKCPGEEE